MRDCPVCGSSIETRWLVSLSKRGGTVTFVAKCNGGLITKSTEHFFTEIIKPLKRTEVNQVKELEAKVRKLENEIALKELK